MNVLGLFLFVPFTECVWSGDEEQEECGALPDTSPLCGVLPLSYMTTHPSSCFGP